ncbi:hypothetical protein [Nocardiopsis lambiniae]|uniref:Glycosyltransferase RgtA/B/C/D-like domain-containing protein n=1 Tax=Nocardiopsis lambiniae TaxID=3075539 RepID=A0ABU2M580_9ACTN|nr:hypothetical protein [Nocardiopsis sp. DSM 44743]MDT0327762.1 hypothetical protein [Nocardiopsis sp. DSM 44743]
MPSATPTTGPEGRSGPEVRVRRPVAEPEAEGPDIGALVTETLRSLREISGDNVFRAAMAILVVAVAAKVYVLNASYFVEDDFLFFGAAYAADLTPDYLFSLHKGHFMPGAMFLVYLQTAFWPYNWWVGAGFMLGLQTLALLVFLRLTWELFGRRWALLVPFTVYALAPLTIPVLGWWAAALNAVPFQLAILLALLWTVRHVRTSDPRHAWWAAGAIAFGMLFSVKALFLPALVFVFAIAFLYPGHPVAATLRAFRAHRVFWSVLVAMTVGYLALYLFSQNAGSGGEGAGVPEWEAASELLRRMFGQVFPVGALGGPFEWSIITPAGGLVEPRDFVVLGAVAMWLLIVLSSLWLRGRAWRAWALLLGYLLFVDAIPTVIARGRGHGLAGADPRYVADAALIFALCLALAFLVVREQRARESVGTAGVAPSVRAAPGRRARRNRAIAAGVLTVGYAAGALYSTHTYADTLNGERLREYLGNVRASMADLPEEGALYPRPVPEEVVLEWNGDRRLTSYVLPPLAPGDDGERLAHPEQGSAAYVFDDDGNLVPGEHTLFSNMFAPGPEHDCLGTLDGAVSWPALAPGGLEQVVTFAYTSDRDAPLVVSVGGGWIETVLPAAPDGGFWHVPAPQQGDRLSLLTEGEEDLCMTTVAFGKLAPNERSTHPIPLSQEGTDEGDADDTETSEDPGSSEDTGADLEASD